MYKVRFYDITGKLVDYCEFSVSENEKFFDKLEEVLYIMSELTPAKSREWKKDLSTYCNATFTYHSVGYSLVEYWWDESKEINVWDIEE